MRYFVTMLMLFVAVMSVTVMAVHADCDPSATGGSGDDDIECSDTTNSDVNGDDGTSNFGGDDSITNDGTVNGDISGETLADVSDVAQTFGGNDTIINEDIVNGNIDGEVLAVADSASGADTIPAIAQNFGGADSIVSDGTVNGDVSGDVMAASASSSNALLAIAQNFGGNDTIEVEGTVNGDVYGDVGAAAVSNTGGGPAIAQNFGGADQISTDGTVNGDITGDVFATASDNIAQGFGGSDTITVRGEVNGDVSGDIMAVAGVTVADAFGGADRIVIEGVINGQVYGDLIASAGGSAFSGDDTVILGDGAQVSGIIYGDLMVALSTSPGFDQLVFSMTIEDEEDYEELAALIAGANPAGGTLVINGRSYTWLNFEELVNALKLAVAEVVSGQPEVVCFTDGRLNNCDLGASLAPYCVDGGIAIYDIAPDATGILAFSVSAAAIDAALSDAASSGLYILVGEGLGDSLYALPDGRLQAMGPEVIDTSKTYTFTFQGDACG